MLGKKIRDKRQEKGIQQYELSEKTGLSSKFLSQLETGKHKTIKITNLEKIATALETPTSFFLENISKKEEEKVA